MATIEWSLELSPGLSWVLCDMLLDVIRKWSETGAGNAHFNYLFLSKQGVIVHRTKAQGTTIRVIFELKQLFLLSRPFRKEQLTCTLTSFGTLTKRDGTSFLFISLSRFVPAALLLLSLWKLPDNFSIVTKNLMGLLVYVKYLQRSTREDDMKSDTLRVLTFTKVSARVIENPCSWCVVLPIVLVCTAL